MYPFSNNRTKGYEEKQCAQYADFKRFFFTINLLENIKQIVIFLRYCCDCFTNSFPLMGDTKYQLDVVCLYKQIVY